jgi:hypothetical protein
LRLTIKNIKPMQNFLATNPKFILLVHSGFAQDAPQKE